MKQLAKLALIFILIALLDSNYSQAGDEYLVAYRTLQVSDGDIGIEFLEQIQSELLEYDINVRFVRWQALEERPDDALVYVSFREQVTSGVITETVIQIYTVAPNLSEISPILEDTTGISFFRKNEAADDLMLGFLLYAFGNASESLEIILSISDTDINMFSPDINRIIGSSYIIEGDLETASDYLENSVWIPENNVFYGVNLAWVYLQLGHSEDAFNLISEAIELSYYEPTTTYLLSVRAQLYALALNYDSAIVDINEAISIAEENELSSETLAELYTIRGEIIFLIYEWDRVEDNFNSAIELNPDYGRAYFQRGILFYTMARREDALADFQTYLELETNGIYVEETQSYIESIEIEIEALGG